LPDALRAPVFGSLLKGILPQPENPRNRAAPDAASQMHRATF
jgi:hypothetical protein